MSEMFSRRVFLRGLGVAAAAAALTSCSSTNEAVNQALIEGAVGGIVAKDCKFTVGTFRSAGAEVPSYYVGANITLNNVSSKPVNITRDNFAVTLDGSPLSPSMLMVFDVGSTSRGSSYVTLTIKPGEERTIQIDCNVNKPTYDAWGKTNQTVTVTFTCGNQRVTYTKNSRSDEITVSDIETL